MKKLLCISLLILPRLIIGQTTVIISEGSVSSCDAVLFDTGGAGSDPYQNGENYTLVICPDTPGNNISLVFNNFSLDNTNTAIAPANNVDNLKVYDGNNTSGILLGTYTGNQLQGTSITATNTTGCITLVFQSNDIGTGDFSATISCSPPCQPPIAIFTSPTTILNPQKICQGESIDFDVSASIAQGPFTITDYIFDYGDGTIDTLQIPYSTHVYNNGPGEYSTKINVIDNNGCINLNSEIINVWVSTTPTFNIQLPIDLCLGESTCLDGSSTTPTTFTDGPSSTISGTTYLPDIVGQCFNAQLNYDFFTPGQTLTDINDLLGIWVNMEHTYMGDLVISIVCPNGTGVVLHQQQGLITQLGDPEQNTDPLLAGAGWDYGWSPIATNGTWGDNSTDGTTQNTTANSSGIESLTSGIYESINPLTPLVGCPLNGIWEIEICDLQSVDDGFVFDFWLDLNPSIYPPLTEFTPVITSDAASTFWSSTGTPNSFITSTSTDNNIICVTPTTTGGFDYTFNALDDFGCTSDTTITLTVAPGPTVNIGNDTALCLGSLFQLNAGQPLIYNYNWTPSTDLSATNISNPIATIGDPITYIVEKWETSHQLCSTHDTIAITLLPILTAGLDGDTTICSQYAPFNMFNALNGTPDIGGSWIDALNNPVSDMYTPSINTGGTYTYIVGYGECSDSATVTITNPDSLLISNITEDSTICIDGSLNLFATSIGGNQPISFKWDNLLVGNGPHTVTPKNPNIYSVYAEDNLGCKSPVKTITIDIHPAIVIDNILNDTICPESSINVTTNATGGNGNGFTYEWYDGSNNPIGTTQTVVISPTKDSETFTVYVGDDCTTPKDTMIFEVFLRALPIISFDTLSTGNYCPPLDLTFNNTTNPLLTQSVIWDFGDGTQSTDSPSADHQYIASGSYDITLSITTPNNCIIDSTFNNYVTVHNKPIADFTFLPTPPNTSNTELYFTNTSLDNDFNYWNFTSGIPNTSENTNPIIIFPNDSAGTYPIELVVENINGCRDTTVGRFVKIDGVFLFYVPNSFTPNGDGINDVFKPSGEAIDITNYSMTIYNRWGKVVFKTNDINAGWDGKYNGEKVPTGVYAWKITAKEKYTPITHNEQGHLSIIN